MTSQIPACKNCKHFQASPDEMFSTCDRYHYETVDYLNGTVKRYNSIAFAMRDKEKFCGREGKNFEMKEFVEEEETFSVRQYLKEKIVNFLLVLGVLKMKPNEKPSWDDAPDWANSLGICNFDVEYKGEWCWCGGTNPSEFICVEQRPELEELK